MQSIDSQPAPRLDWRTRLLHKIEEKCQDEIDLAGKYASHLDEGEWLEGYDPYAIHPGSVGIIEKIASLVTDLEESHPLWDDCILDWTEFVLDAVAEYRHALEVKSRLYHRNLAETGVPATQPRLKVVGGGAA